MYINLLWHSRINSWWVGQSVPLDDMIYNINGLENDNSDYNTNIFFTFFLMSIGFIFVLLNICHHLNVYKLVFIKTLPGVHGRETFHICKMTARGFFSFWYHFLLFPHKKLISLTIEICSIQHDTLDICIECVKSKKYN